MTLADVVVLLAALRQDHVEHGRCRSWLLATVNAPQAFGVSPQILSSVARIVTNRRIFTQITPLDEVFSFSSGLLNASNAVIVTPGPRHWAIFEDTARAANATGDLITDAWFAALAIEHGCTWVTLDRDFRKFRGLRVAAP